MFDSVLAFAKGVDLLRKSSPYFSSSSISSYPPSSSSSYLPSVYSLSSSSSSSSSGSSSSLYSSTLLRASNASCEHEIPWLDGTSLYNYINTVRYIYSFHRITRPFINLLTMEEQNSVHSNPLNSIFLIESNLIGYDDYAYLIYVLTYSLTLIFVVS